MRTRSRPDHQSVPSVTTGAVVNPVGSVGVIEHEDVFGVAEGRAGLLCGRRQERDHVLLTRDGPHAPHAGRGAADELPPNSPHGAIGAEYAHVTAPLRRLVDRYGLEICLAATADADVPVWVRAGLAGLPATMLPPPSAPTATSASASTSSRRCCWPPGSASTSVVVVVDVAQPRKGESKATKGTVVVAEPAVRATVVGDDLPLGEATTVTLTQADPDERKVTFSHP